MRPGSCCEPVNSVLMIPCTGKLSCVLSGPGAQHDVPGSGPVERHGTRAFGLEIR